MDNSPLAGVRILITGITGFVGSHLASRLTKLEAIVYGLSRTTHGDRMLTGSVFDPKALEAYLSANQITHLVHLAGLTTVEAGIRDPASVFRVNIEGTRCVLDAARRAGIERLIVTSTVHVYGRQDAPCTEEFAFRSSPSRPYETSKACADLLAQSYAHAYRLPVLIPRFVNLFGPGDTHTQRLIPRTIQSVLRGESPTMWGGGCQREYLYVDDAVEAYVRLLQTPWAQLGSAHTFNIGTEQPMSVRAVIEKVLAVSGVSLSIRRVETERPDEVPLQSVSSARARVLLGWRPETSLDTGVKATLAWYATSLGDASLVRKRQRAEHVLPA